MNTIQIPQNAKYRKLDPLTVFFSTAGKMKLQRFKPHTGWLYPNAVALEDLRGGCFVEIDMKDGIAEVKEKK